MCQLETFDRCLERSEGSSYEGIIMPRTVTPPSQLDALRPTPRNLAISITFKYCLGCDKTCLYNATS